MTNSTAKNRLREFVPTAWSDFDSLLSQVLSSGGVRSACGVHAPVSVWEDDASYHVEVDLPGVARDDVGLTLDKGELEIVAERKRPEGDRKSWHEQRIFGQIKRSVTLPDSIDAESVKAELSDGVLRVVIAKSPAAQPRRIDVR